MIERLNEFGIAFTLDDVGAESTEIALGLYAPGDVVEAVSVGWPPDSATTTS